MPSLAFSAESDEALKQLLTTAPKAPSDSKTQKMESYSPVVDLRTSRAKTQYDETWNEGWRHQNLTFDHNTKIEVTKSTWLYDVRPSVYTLTNNATVEFDVNTDGFTNMNLGSSMVALNASVFGFEGKGNVVINANQTNLNDTNITDGFFVSVDYVGDSKKRKLFIDSLALQITNDSFIEEYVEGNITIDKLEKTYIKDLKSNKNSNQLNMTEDLNLSEIIEKLRLYVDKEITSYLTENAFLVNAINSLLDKTKKELEDKLQELISSTDNKYLKILTDELKQNVVEKEKGEDDVMMEDKSMETAMQPSVNAVATNKFEKYDDMTLFNKVILSLNTKEEKLYRKEMKLEKRKDEVDERLTATNKNIEANIERENKLSQRKLELNSREVELNSKLSEAEVIFLNIKPLIKGLNKIKVSDEMGGNDNE